MAWHHREEASEAAQEEKEEKEEEEEEEEEEPVTLENAGAAVVKVAEVAADFSTISTKPSVRRQFPMVTTGRPCFSFRTGEEEGGGGGGGAGGGGMNDNDAGGIRCSYVQLPPQILHPLYLLFV